MSGRISASARQELFTARSAPEGKQGDYGAAAEEKHVDDTIEDDIGPLQMQHMMGYAGDFRQTVLASARDDNLYIKSLGSLVCIENLTDPHDQKLLRGHDMPVCALCVAPSGRMIASGQIGTKSFKGYASPIFVWRLNQEGMFRRSMVLRGMSYKVNHISISPDERFLCGCGEDKVLYIWDLSSGEVAYGQTLPAPASIMKWVSCSRDGHYIAYDLVVGHGKELYNCRFSFQPDRVQWSLALKAFAMPPGGGITRTFTTLDFSEDRVFVYVGTTGGEILTFRRDTEVFRACIPVCSNGVQGILVLPEETGGGVLVAGGDGTITRLEGSDMSWRLALKAKMDSAVNSLSLSANRSELIVGCSSGSIYRCLARTLTSHIVSEGHTSGVSAIAFNTPESMHTGQGSSLIFASGTQSGELRLWDLSDYACLAVCRYPKSGAILCLQIVTDDRVISGWHDGAMRCHGARNLDELWCIAAAHRGGTRSLSVHIDANVHFIASAGGDCTVRVWRLTNRELVTQYTDHTKSISCVAIDLQTPNYVHTVSDDLSVVTFDIKSNKRRMCHLMGTGGVITSLTQRRDSELELVTVDTLGRILQWDIDYREPVQQMQDPSRVPLHCCSISPSGKYLAFAGDDQLLKILEIATGSVVAMAQGHSNKVKAIAWTPDEKQVVSGGDDMSLCCWNFYL